MRARSDKAEIRRLRAELRRVISVLDGVLASTQEEQYALNELISRIEKTLGLPRSSGKDSGRNK